MRIFIAAEGLDARSLILLSLHKIRLRHLAERSLGLFACIIAEHFSDGDLALDLRILLSLVFVREGWYEAAGRVLGFFAILTAHEAETDDPLFLWLQVFGAIVIVVGGRLCSLLVLFFESDGQLLELLDLWGKLVVLHTEEECSQPLVERRPVTRYDDLVAEPLRHALRVGAPREPLVCENNSAIVLHVPDDAANGLVDRSRRLLIVPVTTFECSQLFWGGDIGAPCIEIVLLQDDLWISYHRVRNAHHNNQASSVIRKV